MVLYTGVFIAEVLVTIRRIFISRAGDIETFAAGSLKGSKAFAPYPSVQLPCYKLMRRFQHPCRFGKCQALGCCWAKLFFNQGIFIRTAWKVERPSQRNTDRAFIKYSLKFISVENVPLPFSKLGEAACSRRSLRAFALTEHVQ